MYASPMLRHIVSTLLGCAVITTMLTPGFYTPPAANTAHAAETEIMAWVYPGSPACNARNEYADGRVIHILKPEYYAVNERGTLTLLTESNAGCNGYSTKNVADIKKYSQEQYVTVAASSAEGMDLFIKKALTDRSGITTLVNFAVTNEFEGVELDFEDFGSWDTDIYARYRTFVTELGNALHTQNKKLMIDGPAIADDNEQDWFVWDYSDFSTLPVDTIVVMAYDYQYDHGAGSPVAPLSWITDVTERTLREFPYAQRLSIGIPSYGYRGTVGSYKVRLLTYTQITKEAGFANAKRDLASQEMTWRNGSTVYFFQDAESIRKKIKAVTDAGISSVSVWHLGGNRWF